MLEISLLIRGPETVCGELDIHTLLIQLQGEPNPMPPSNLFYQGKITVT